MSALPTGIRNDFIDAIRDAFVDLPAFSSFLVNNSMSDFDDKMVGVSGFREKIDIVVRCAEVSKGKLMHLLNAALTEEPTNEKLIEIKAAILSAAGTPTENFFESCLLFGKASFVNRNVFRDLLEEILFTESRLLKICGEAQSGKTHSVFFILSLSRFLGISSYWFDLKDYVGKKPSHLYKIIVGRLFEDEIGAVDEKGDLLGSKIVRRIEESRERNFCLVFDNCNTPGLFDELNAIIEYMSKQAIVAGNLRLVLIGEDPAIPIEAQIAAVEEEIQRPTPEDIKHFLQKVSLLEHQELSDDEADREVDLILDSLDEEAEFMPALNEAIEAWRSTKL